MPQVAAIYIQNPTRELIERDFRPSVCPTSVAGAAGTNWNSAPPNTVPDNLATFTNNSAPTSVTISNSTSINTIAFDAAAPAYSFTVQNGATFTINNSSSSTSNFSVSSGATLAIGNGGSVEIGSLAGAGALQLGASDPNTLLFIAGSTSTTFSGVISGPGSIELDDAATLRLTGRGSVIGGDLDLCLCSTGSLTVDGGSLTVNGFAQGVTVEGGTLSVINGGTWPAPGSEDTELGVILEPEVVYGTQTLCTRVQA
jgi:hypothetical protein